MTPLRTRTCTRLCLVLAVVMVPLWRGSADAGKLNCRNLTFSGQAGDCTNPDIVEIQMVDAQGLEIHRSCNLFVHTAETALHFGSRVPRDLSSFGDCTSDSTEPPPIKKCWNGANGSCKYKWKAKKQLLQVCCWETPDCRGRKLGNYCNGGIKQFSKCASDADCPGAACEMRAGTQGISAQKRIQGEPQFGPTPVPVTLVTTLVQLDPIGMTQLPFPSLGSCRTGIAKTVQALTATTLEKLVTCHHRQMRGEPLADCNSVNGDSDPNEAVATAEDAVTTAAEACKPAGSPRALGYGTCPDPCTMSVNTCAAPVSRVGAPCATDSDCDSALGAGDGKCGRVEDWDAAADCLMCQAETAVVDAITDKYGSIGSDAPPDAIDCQDQIGKALQGLVRTQVAVTAKCQKLLDGGKTVLAFCQSGECVGPPSHVGEPCMTNDDCTPPDTQLCKYADQSHARSLNEIKARSDLDQACGQTDFSTLDTCGIDLASEQDCVIANGRTTGDTIADAIFPEGVGHDAP